MGTQTHTNRRIATMVAGAAAAGALLLAGPAATAFADTGDTTAPTPKVAAAAAAPDYSIGGFLNNAGQFAGALGTNTNQFIGTLGTNANQLVGVGGNNLNQFVGVGGNNVNQFVGTLGTNGLVFAGTLGNNLVGNPPNTGGKVTATSATTSRVSTSAKSAMKGNFQCNSTGSASCSGR